MIHVHDVGPCSYDDHCYICRSKALEQEVAQLVAEKAELTSAYNAVQDAQEKSAGKIRVS